MPPYARPRRYVSPALITATRPFLRYSDRRDAYVLRAVGGRMGPVLRPDRRRRKRRIDWSGPERRRTAALSA